MQKHEIIERLLNLEFICLDKDEDEQIWVEVGREYRESFLYKHINNQKFVSFKTIEQFRTTQKSGTFDDFHLCSHYIMIDRLISFVSTEIAINLEGIIGETLRCATDKNEELINALYALQPVELQKVA